MAEYIEREAVLKRLKFKIETDTTYNHLKYRGLESAMAQVRKAPAADVAPVVRCKDCIYYEKTYVNGKGFRICPASRMDVTDMDFCSYGERRVDHEL